MTEHQNQARRYPRAGRPGAPRRVPVEVEGRKQRRSPVLPPVVGKRHRSSIGAALLEVARSGTDVGFGRDRKANEPAKLRRAETT